MDENKVSDLFTFASEKFKGLIDANTVIGDVITVGDGTIIIPVSKITFGFGGGGNEFEKKNTEGTRFGGGIGGGASVRAEAFLVVNNDNVRLISMDAPVTPVDKVIDMVPGIIDKANGFLSGFGEKRAAKKAAKKAEKQAVDVIGEGNDKG
ncbi:MAG: sporulation protein YtfJ [Clostridia bacterium]|nr:sporulation protein YtfJ [Clostridia bacterium]MBQ2669638.1 sporulation protein YtfJ [Clostridia bacterium]MBQ3461941.1 sporulation protein YtfJ [Clostridia bacterium]MBQ6530701.1 sporulation protein YtfJ [Clostridia bacterium]MBQ6558966.1 sporulation protein YtfJ [Clostridia bacterium]